MSGSFRVTMDTPGLLESIEAKLEAPRPDCLIWPGAVDRGYGRVWVDGKAKRVHRVVWELKNGPIPDGLTVDHLCRIRACCNTEHMELVTGGENASRGASIRAEMPRGEFPVVPARRRRVRRSSLAERVMDYVEVEGDHWLFDGVISKQGVPIITINGSKRSARRVMWEHVHGELDQADRVATACEHSTCCNPDHLRLWPVGRRRLRRLAA